MKHGDKKKYGWMQRRMEDLWYGWSEAKHKLDLPRRRQKKVPILCVHETGQFHQLHVDTVLSLKKAPP